MSASVFYLPSLLRESVSQPLPAQVAFFPAGLPVKPGAAAAEQPSPLSLQAEKAVREALPLNPEEAKATLGELLRMGEEYAAGGLLRELAAHQTLTAREGPWAGKSGEFADLERFAASGELPEERPAVKVSDWGAAVEARIAGAQAVRQTLVDCQKTLLLAHSLEERRRELERLEDGYRQAERSLMDALGEGGETGWSFSVQTAGRGHDPETGQDGPFPEPVSLSWRVVADAVLPFLPEKGVLFTADAGMAADLRDAGMLQPFPGDRAAVCEGWPESLVTGLLFVSVPAWRLVGRRGPLPERPWLEREVEVFVARPRQGWAR